MDLIMDYILENGIFIDTLNITIQIKCHAFIADAPERASVLNMNRYNGKYGCVLCMQEGENLKKNKQGKNFKFTIILSDTLYL